MKIFTSLYLFTYLCNIFIVEIIFMVITIQLHFYIHCFIYLFMFPDNLSFLKIEFFKKKCCFHFLYSRFVYFANASLWRILKYTNRNILKIMEKKNKANNQQSVEGGTNKSVSIKNKFVIKQRNERCDWMELRWR